jgi:hypothetical protein
VDTNTLRLNAYSVTADGKIDCFRESRPDERTAVLRIDLAEDSKAGHDIVKRLLSVVDEPRGLTGVSRNGSAIVLFRCDKNPAPNIQGSDSRNGIFELATRDGLRFTVTCASDGQALAVDAYTWPKGRSPLEIGSWTLPILTAEIGAAVVFEAFNLGATWSPVIEQERKDAARLAQFRADVASGKVKILTDAEQEAADDEKLVAAHEGKDISYSDGPLACNVLAARKRVAQRKREAAAA